MFKDIFTKKENLFIISIFLVSTLLIVFGFLLLFFKTDTSSEVKIVQNNLNEIIWSKLESNIFDKDVTYPSYLYTIIKEDDFLIGVSLTERKTDQLLTYFDNHNHISFYPEGVDNQFFYGKTKESEYTSSVGQQYLKTEYFTQDDNVWAVMLVPKELPKNWQSRGFIWIQSLIKNKEQLCISQNGILIAHIECDPYSGEQPVYKGEVSEKFIRLGYELIDKNRF